MGIKGRLMAIFLVLCAFAGLFYVGYTNMPVQVQVTDDVVEGVYPNKETIYFWYSDETMTDYLNSAAVSFGQLNDARVIPVLVSDSEFLEAINSATLYDTKTPDAYILSNDVLERAYLAGYADPIQDVAGVCNTAHFPQSALSAVTYKDKLVAYPFYYETSAFLYNKTYLEKWTAEQLAGAGNQEEETITGGDYGSGEESDAVSMEQLLAGIPQTMGEVLVFAQNYDAPDNVEAVLRWDVSDIFYNYQFVGSHMTVGGENGDDPTELRLHNNEVKECLRVYQNLNQFFYIESSTVSYESVVQDFIKGEIVFTIATTDVIATLEQAKADGSFIYEYGIANIPRPTDELDGRSLSVTNCIAINSYSTHRELANKFAAYLTNEYHETLYSRTGKVSSNLAANLDNEHLQMFMEEYKTSYSLPKMIKTSNFWIRLEILFSQVWEGGDIDTLLRDMTNQIAQQLK